ncbi:MAG: hypothetical protein H6624_03015 [Bdellovibrionaceae bacterium]|nr:hypothetical protein [Bdellovibrionales bacterium]MCB9083284.1 hypothetical protein [Pseudobdellovibrionaceae bacterium]
MKAFRLILSVVLIVGFYLGLQIGGPWWDSSHFNQGRTYQLIPRSGDGDCADGPNDGCRRELVFDSGGRVLLVEAGLGRSGTYKLKGSYLLLSLSDGEGGKEEISLLLQEDKQIIVEPGSTRSWRLMVRESRGES